MMRHVSTAVLGFVTVASLCAFGGEPAKKDPAGEIAELRTRVKALEAEVQRLQQSLASEQQRHQLDVHYAPLTFVPAATTQPSIVVRSAGEKPKMPEGTVEREFNGATVYLVPLAGSNVVVKPTAERQVKIEP